MILFFIFIIIGLFMVSYSLYSSPSYIPENKKVIGKYEGGIKEWINRDSVTVTNTNEGVRVERITGSKDNERVIPYSKINDVNVKTEVEMTSSVTLTRMLAFGIFSLGLKKKKEQEHKFLLINYIDESDNEQNLVVSSKSISEVFYLDTLTNKRQGNQN